MIVSSEAERAGFEQSESYLNSPARVVEETGQPFRMHLTQPCPELPILEELRLAGATDYLMLPLPFLDRIRLAVISFATRDPNGFGEAHLNALMLAARLFSPYAERHVLRRMTADLMNTYVGPRTGQRVIDGFIERGSFERIEAAIWIADLRGFTRLSETAPVQQVIAKLNAWCEAMIGPIEQHGGEVLKFIGDAVLAIFPTSELRTREQACLDALAAGEQFSLAWHDGRLGGDFILALHFGDVAYGNIGAPRRLDFTVIGPAVNRAARLQELAKTLGYSVVTTSALASSLPHGRVQDLGSHKLRDIEEFQHVFAPDWATKLRPGA